MTLEELRRDWTTLGEQDPLWAVYVAPGKKGGAWDVEAFYATGPREVDSSLRHVEELGLHPGREVALDFGCGVGRLSAALAQHVEHVVSVDISPTMVAEAKRQGRCGDNVTFVLNDKPDLSFQPSASVDLVYSSLVLQHLPRDLASGYLAEFGRVLRPGGVAVVQVATRPTLSLRGILFRTMPARLVGWLQKRFLDYPAPMRMTAMPRPAVDKALAGSGLGVVHAVDETIYGGHWITTRYFLLREPAPAA
jgi:SAM-dependent methyltransferase